MNRSGMLQGNLNFIPKEANIGVTLALFKDPVLPIEHCKLRSLGGHFCDVENSEAFVCGQNRTL